MTLAEIKIEALKLMFANVDTDLSVENITTYKTQQAYREYLANMPGSINRCFSDLENKQVLPEKVSTLHYSDGTAMNNQMSFTVPSNIYNIVRIAFVGDNCYKNNVDYIVNANTLILPAIREGEYYMVVYVPKLARVTTSTEESTAFDIPDYIATAIPYYIKGDLFRVDEPNEASEARNWYENVIANISPINTNGQDNVDNTYCVGE